MCELHDDRGLQHHHRHAVQLDVRCGGSILRPNTAELQLRAVGENTNKKQDIATQFSYCEMLDDATNISVYVDSVDSLLGSSAGLAPVVPNCTTDENNETVDFFLAVATNESCQYDSSICAYDVHVNTDCDTECGRLVRRLGFDVPKCYFDHVNHREYLSDHWYQCEWIVNP